ncbi:MAG: hypothetical protein ACTSSE_10415 [Candidatus Thorarchaeota archaeon]
MVHKPRHNRKISRRLCILFLTIGILSVLPITISAQDTLSFSMNRTMGLGFGSYISGTFTLHGSGPDTIQNLTVYFNDVEVHFVTGNTISWLFDTGNYEGGATNITLIGIDDVGEVHSTTHQVVFIGESINTLIYMGVITLVVVLLLAKYGTRIIGLRKK